MGSEEAAEGVGLSLRFWNLSRGHCRHSHVWSENVISGFVGAIRVPHGVDSPEATEACTPGAQGGPHGRPMRGLPRELDRQQMQPPEIAPSVMN